MVKSTEKEGSGLLGCWNGKCPPGRETRTFVLKPYPNMDIKVSALKEPLSIGTLYSYFY